MPRNSVARFRFVILIGALTWSLAPAQESSAPSAAQILRNVVATYGAMASYSDKGVSITKIDAKTQISRDFESLFERPGKLRFAWNEEWSDRRDDAHQGRFVIWSDGTTAWSSYPFNDNTPVLEKSLVLAVAGATGISGGAAHYIPRLFFDGLSGLRVDQRAEFSVTGEETVDGVTCVRLDAPSLAVWIGRDDNLIRKIATEGHVETHTGIVVNAGIDDAAFKE